MTRSGSAATPRIYAGLFLLSASTLLFQVTLTRLFSASIWYHFAFLVVSVALFGFGASGVALSLVPPGPSDARRRAASAAAFALGTLLAYLGTRAVPFEPFAILSSPIQILYFVLYDLFLLVPFFFAGATVALTLRAFPAQTGSLYALDLVGAGVGSLLLFLALPRLGAPGAVALAASLGLAASACFSARWPTRALLGTAAAAVLLGLGPPGRLPDLRVDSTKALVTELRNGGRTVFTAWNPLGRIDVVERSGVDPMIFIDSAAMTPIARYRGAAPGPGEDLTGAAYVLHPAPAVVIIGSGGGIDVQQAIRLGARSVTAIEINPVIIDLVTRKYRDYVGGIFADPRVHLVRDEGRSRLERSAERVDILQITLIDTWAAGASGAYSLTENYLYTTEALRTYLEHLRPDGVLSITRWNFEVPRLVALGRAALESMRVADPAGHFVILQQQMRTLFLMKREPFSARELAALRSFAAAAGMQVQYDPQALKPGSFYDRYLRARDVRPVIDRAPIALAPVGDDDPFFFQMARWDRLRPQELTESVGRSILEPLAVPAAQIALLTALAIAVLLSVVLLSVPVLARSVPRQHRWGWLGYFAALGIGYIMVEVILMQRFALFLGHPTYSVTMVLFVILLFSGLGSAWSGSRHGTTAEVLRPVLWLLPLALLVLTFAVPPLVHRWIGLPHPVRLLVSAAFIAPVAFLMGMPFPVGVRAVSASGPAHLPWAWAANGCASVIGSVSAVLGAMLWNFSTMLLGAAAIYVLALAWLCRRRIQLAGPPAPRRRRAEAPVRQSGPQLEL